MKPTANVILTQYMNISEIISDVEAGRILEKRAADLDKLASGDQESVRG